MTDSEEASAAAGAAPSKFGVQLRPVEVPATVPAIEIRPEFSLVSLRAVPANRRRQSTAVGRKLDKSELVQVELLPGSFGGPEKPVVVGYGQAPKSAQVFDGDDDDDVTEAAGSVFLVFSVVINLRTQCAADLEQVELNLEAEVGGNLNMDLSAEYQKPRVDRAIQYSRRHRPHRPNGEDWGLWDTRTGRFVSARGAKLDIFCEGRKSELISFVYCFGESSSIH